MNKTYCPVCGAKARKHTTRNKKVQWVCTNKSCSIYFTRTYRSLEKDFALFKAYVLGDSSQKSMPGCGRTFRRHTEKFWELWPLSEPTEEVYDVLFLDAIYINHKNTAILIACTFNQQVLSWYVSQGETCAGWIKVLERLVKPSMVVCDGATGLLRALKILWPDVLVQRCLFHVAANIYKATTRYPKTKCAKELKALAQRLQAVVKTQEERLIFEVDFEKWCLRYAKYLSEPDLTEAQIHFNRKDKLRTARKQLKSLIVEGRLFSYLSLSEHAYKLSSLAFNNYIEGAINAPIRECLRRHRGMDVIRRIKLVFWWCYFHSPYQLDIKCLMEVLPTDDMIKYGLHPTKQDRGYSGAPDMWGDAVVWDELHRSYPFRRRF